MTMEIQTTFGLWILVEVRGETHYIPPDVVSLGLKNGEAITQDSLREKTPKSETDRFARDLMSLIEGGATCSTELFNTIRDAAYAEADSDWEDAVTAIKDYVEAECTVDTVEEIEVWEGWGARYHMLGYMDQTDWVLGDTEDEAVEECKEMFGSEDDDDDYELDGENILEDEDEQNPAPGQGIDGLDFIVVDDKTAPQVKMVSGYCHEFESQDASAEDMECQVYTSRGDEEVMEYRNIDGSWHVVFYCPVDGMYRAQTCVAVGTPNPV